MTNKIMPKDIVERWVKEVMTQSYDITVYPQECSFGEKFLRSLQRDGWQISVIEDLKLVISSNDPIKLAHLALRLRKQGYLIQD